MPVKSGRLSRIARLGGMAAGLAGDAAAGLASRGSAAAHRHAAERMARVLGEMKGLPHKVGQILSTLDDVLPAEQRELWAQVLGRLQAHADPLPWPEVQAVLEAELGCPVDAAFAALDPAPAAAASIGQVHRGRLPDGREVAVKVQYPGVAEALDADLANVGALVGTLSAVLPQDTIEHLVHEVTRRFAEELDYAHEAAAQEDFRARQAGNPRVVVPAVVDELSTARVLTSEWVEGLDFEAACAAPAAERDAWGEALWAFCWRSVLDQGWLHADPHPGNYRFLPDGRVAVLDYGCTTPVPPAVVEGLLGLAHGLLDGLPDAELQPHLEAALDLPRALDPALAEPLLSFAHLLFEPVTALQPWRFSRAYTRAFMEASTKTKLTVSRRALRRGMPTPQGDAVPLLLRTSLGLASVLSHLESRADFRRAAGLG